MEKLIKQLKQDEGFVGTPYPDSLGNWTVGYGHLMSNPISEKAASYILQDDIDIAIHKFAKLPLSIRKHLNEARRRVVISMIFNMGLGNDERGFLSFKDMIRAIKNDDFEQAALEILDSLMARQVGDREIKWAEIMKHGGN